MKLNSILCAAIVGSSVLSACTLSGIGGNSEVRRGKVVFEKECASCHGRDGRGAGPESLGLGVLPPDLTQLSVRNDGAFPEEFIRQFVMGQLESDVIDKTMPDFSKAGLRHVYPAGGADGEMLEGAFSDLIAYLESIQSAD